MSDINFTPALDDFVYFIDKEMDLDYLVISDNPEDLRFIDKLMRTGYYPDIDDWMPIDHKQICIYRSEVRSFDDKLHHFKINKHSISNIYKTNISLNGQIHVVFFGDVNKQHILISGLFVSPYINRRRVFSSDKAHIWYHVDIPYENLKYQHCECN